MTDSDKILLEAANRLLDTAPGPDWWPGSPWTIAVSAVLVQQTTWKQAARAVSQLADAANDPEHLRTMSAEEVGERVRCSGFWRRKVSTLRALADIWHDLARTEQDRRARLLEITGIGPETADAICCYAFMEPVLVVDAMTARLTTRLTGGDVGARNYDALQQRWMQAIDPIDNISCRRLHAAIVEHARAICRLRDPSCSRCNLRAICAHGNSMAHHAFQ